MALRCRCWIIVVLVGCGAHPKAGTVPHPVSPELVQQAQTRFPAATEASLEQGRELFVSRCKKCHDLPDRRAYADDRWPKILDKMARKAKLDAEQHQLVLQFILAERALAPST